MHLPSLIIGSASALLFFPSTWAASVLQVDPPASRNMLVQRNHDLPLSGQAAPGSTVTATLQDKTASAKADASGAWSLKLPAVSQTGGPFSLVIESGGEKLDWDNVLVGDVWFCSGQSNMQFPLRVIAPDIVPGITNPQLRLLQARNVASPTPLTSNDSRWTRCDPQSAENFSATAYFFGKHLAKDSGVPIGLLVSAWGGKRAEAFTRREALVADPDLKPLVDRWEAKMARYPEDLKAFETTGRAKQEKRSAALEAQGLGRRTIHPPPGPDSPEGTSTIWNGQISPFLNQPITGILWYQGESNALFAEQYGKLLPAMITDWRQQWGLGDLPFFVVQLAGYLPRSGEQYKFEKAHPGQTPPPVESEWAELRESQGKASRLPGAALATAIDLGEKADIHPKQKDELGRRLSLLALKQVYGKGLEDRGPVLDKVSFEGDKAIVTFSHAKDLQAKGGGPVKGFALAAEDRKFVWAEATINGGSVTLTASGVSRPVAVRYAWADFPDANLVNADGLPAFPFRTDTWPGLTAGKR